jgi:hypothetical protein
MGWIKELGIILGSFMLLLFLIGGELAFGVVVIGMFIFYFKKNQEKQLKRSKRTN